VFGILVYIYPDAARAKVINTNRTSEVKVLRKETRSAVEPSGSPHDLPEECSDNSQATFTESLRTVTRS
jgi:hypothetical protein